MALSEKVSQWIEKNKVPIFSLLGIFLALGLISVGWKQFFDYQERSAQSALYLIEAQIKKKQEEISKEVAGAKDEDKTNKRGGAKDKKSPSPGRNLEVDFGPLLEEYAAKIKELKGRKASLIGAIRLAALYMEYGDFEKAQSLLTDMARGVSPAGKPFFGLIYMQSGTALMATAKYEEARAKFQMVLDDPDSSFLHAEAVLKLGLVEEKLGNLEKAREHYTRAKQEFFSTDAGRTAQSYLRLIKSDGS